MGMGSALDGEHCPPPPPPAAPSSPLSSAVGACPVGGERLCICFWIHLNVFPGSETSHHSVGHLV